MNRSPGKGGRNSARERPFSVGSLVLFLVLWVSVAYADHKPVPQVGWAVRVGSSAPLRELAKQPRAAAPSTRPRVETVPMRIVF